MPARNLLPDINHTMAATIKAGKKNMAAPIKRIIKPPTKNNKTINISSPIGPKNNPKKLKAKGL